MGSLQNDTPNNQSSYIEEIENKISASLPATKEPKLSAVSKGMAKKTATVFAVMLML